MVTSPDSKQLASLPLAEIAPRLGTLISKMTIADVAALLGQTGKEHAVAARPAGAPASSGGSLDEIAQAILAPPESKHRLRDVERAVVAHALLTTHGNVSPAARLLGTERKALERRIARYRLAAKRG